MIMSRRLSLFKKIDSKIFLGGGKLTGESLVDPKWDLGATYWDSVQLFEPIIERQESKTTRQSALVWKLRMMVSCLEDLRTPCGFAS